jgi:hypothetical protein
MGSSAMSSDPTNSSENEPAPDVPGADEAAALPAPPGGIQIAAAAQVPGDGAVPDAPGKEPRPGQAPWWRPRPFARPLWYPVAGGAAAVALVAGGAMTLLTISHGPRARPLADDCGLVTCGATLPHVVTRTAVPSTAVRSTAPARRHHRRAHRRVLAPAAHSFPSPAPPAPPARRHPGRPHRGQAAPPAVTVTYGLDGTDPWHQDFRAHLTIVNNGRTPVTGWSVQVSLPGDQVDWVGYPGGWDPFANWQFNGETLVLNAVSGGETLAPGATEIVPISAQGANTTPGGCLFNGSACQP